MESWSLSPELSHRPKGVVSLENRHRSLPASFLEMPANQQQASSINP